jgi:hypothetical protein
MKKISQILLEVSSRTEPVKKVVPKLTDHLREAYISGKIFKVGQMVECDLGLAEIIDRGPTYVTLVKDGETFKRWVKDVTLSESSIAKRSQIYKESFIIKGYKTKHFTRELAEMFNLVNKKTSDKFALFSCAVCVDKLLGASEKQLAENFDIYRVEFDRATKYLSKFNIVVNEMSKIEDTLLEHAIINNLKFSAVNKSKVANIISHSVGLVTESKDPVVVINESIDHIKCNKYSTNGWKVIGGLFNKATEAGINWDKSKFASHTQKYMELK